jgi:putative acetyltransferase
VRIVVLLDSEEKLWGTKRSLYGELDACFPLVALGHRQVDQLDRTSEFACCRRSPERAPQEAAHDLVSLLGLRQAGSRRQQPSMTGGTRIERPFECQIVDPQCRRGLTCGFLVNCDQHPLSIGHARHMNFEDLCVFNLGRFDLKCLEDSRRAHDTSQQFVQLSIRRWVGKTLAIQEHGHLEGLAVVLAVDSGRKSRLQSNYTVRVIQKQDNAQVARLIRNVMTEFQAVGEGYSIGDPEVDDMHGSYGTKRSCYYVIVLDNTVVGCGGIGPLAGGHKFTCELRKMFFLPETRGIGLGRRLLLLLMDEARKRDYRKCYLETLDRMWRANELYQKNGFQLLEKPIGKTGHRSCDRWYLLNL